MRVTKKDLERQAFEAKTTAEILLAALQYTAIGASADAFVEVGVIGEGHYTYSLYGAQRSHGGIVIVTYKHEGQAPYSSAHYLDDLEHRYRSGKYGSLEATAFPPQRGAVGHLIVQRERICSAASRKGA